MGCMARTELVHALATEGHVPGEEKPERRAQGIDVGANVHRRAAELLRTRESRRADKSSVR